MEIISKNEKEHRLNHINFGSVYETTYKYGIIKNFGIQDELPILTDICKVEVSGLGTYDVPIFYHCKNHCYTENVRTLKDNKALLGGAKAFQVGDEVKVLLKKNRPRYVIGHADHEPRMCLDIFKIRYNSWHDPILHEIHYIGETQQEYCGIDQPCKDYYGNNIECNQKGYILFGKREFQVGTIMNYYGDHYVKVGPLFYIIRIKSIGLPAPFTGSIDVFAAVWTKELEEECIRLGQMAEETISNKLPTFPKYPSEVRRQPIFSRTFVNRFSGFSQPQPRWLLTEWYGQSWEN